MLLMDIILSKIWNSEMKNSFYGLRGTKNATEDPTKIRRRRGRSTAKKGLSLMGGSLIGRASCVKQFLRSVRSDARYVFNIAIEQESQIESSTVELLQAVSSLFSCCPVRPSVLRVSREGELRILRAKKSKRTTQKSALLCKAAALCSSAID